MAAEAHSRQGLQFIVIAGLFVEQEFVRDVCLLPHIYQAIRALPATSSYDRTYVSLAKISHQGLERIIKMLTFRNLSVILIPLADQYPSHAKPMFQFPANFLSTVQGQELLVTTALSFSGNGDPTELVWRSVRVGLKGCNRKLIWKHD